MATSSDGVGEKIGNSGRRRPGQRVRTKETVPRPDSELRVIMNACGGSPFCAAIEGRLTAQEYLRCEQLRDMEDRQ